MTRAPAIVVTPRLPWPLDDGGRLGLWQFVDSVARDRATILVALVPPEELAAPLPGDLAARGIEVVRVPHRPPGLARAALAGLFDPMPVVLARYKSPALAATLQRLVHERRPAFVLLNHLHLAPFADDCRPAPTVLRQHNVEHLWFERYAAAQGNPFARAWIADQARRLRGAEARLCAGVDLVLAIHEDEARLLRALAPAAHVETVPFGIAFPAEPPRRAPGTEPTALMVGTWSWPPNSRGALRFLTEAWPQLRAEVPGIRLRVVGKGAGGRLRAAAAAAGPGIDWVGYVPSMDAEWARADVLVVPLWEGAGVRVKIVEGLAAGVPIVATALAAEGLELVPERDYAAGETPAQLAAGVARVLARPDRGRALADLARERARAVYSLDAVAARLRPLLAAFDAPAARTGDGAG